VQNQRPVSSGLAATVNRSSSGELLLTFVDIYHPALSRVIRVVVEDDGGISYVNGKPVNYKLDGEVYLATPFRLSWLSENDGPPEARATIPAIDREIADEIRSLNVSPRLRMRVLKSSDFDVLYDQDNARSPLGMPTVEFDADYLFLSDVQGNGMSISARVVRFDLGNEPYPAQRATKAYCPALFL
jgi:Domain of unknown function (DUF1833)